MDLRNAVLVAQLPTPLDERARIELSPEDELLQWRRTHEIALDAKTQKKIVTFRGIQLPSSTGPHQLEFTAYAFNQDRVKSETSPPYLYRYEIQSHRARKKARAYVITVGVGASQDPSWDLWFAADGARKVQKWLAERLNGMGRYEVVPVSLLSDYETGGAGLAEKTATKGNLEALLARLAGRVVGPDVPAKIRLLPAATPDDLVVLYVASHGYLDPEGVFYLMPYDIGEAEGVSAGPAWLHARAACHAVVWAGRGV